MNYITVYITNKYYIFVEINNNIYCTNIFIVLRKYIILIKNH